MYSFEDTTENIAGIGPILGQYTPRCCHDRMGWAYWNISFYLVISYGVSCAYILIVVGFNALSVPVAVSISCIVVLIVFTVVTFPFGIRYMAYLQVSFVLFR